MPAENAGRGQAVAQLAEHLGELRFRAGLTWRELGALAHVDHASLWRAVHGVRCPTREVTKAFAQACERQIACRSDQVDTLCPQLNGGDRGPGTVDGSVVDSDRPEWVRLWDAAKAEVNR